MWAGDPDNGNEVDPALAVPCAARTVSAGSGAASSVTSSTGPSALSSSGGDPEVAGAVVASPRGGVQAVCAFSSPVKPESLSMLSVPSAMPFADVPRTESDAGIVLLGSRPKLILPLLLRVLRRACFLLPRLVSHDLLRCGLEQPALGQPDLTRRARLGEVVHMDVWASGRRNSGIPSHARALGQRGSHPRPC